MNNFKSHGLGKPSEKRYTFPHSPARVASHSIVRCSVAQYSQLQLTVNTIKTAESLVPYSKDAVNLGTLVWDLIDSVPPGDRHKILDQLSDSDILRLWRISGEKNKATVSQIAASKVPEYSVWEDMPREGSSSSFKGRAVLPIRMGMGTFDKELFYGSCDHIDSKYSEEEVCMPIFGRVVHSGYAAVLKEMLYPGPLYFKAIVGSSIVPILSDTCDLVFSYSLDEYSMEAIRNVGASQGWRAPKANNPSPFDGDYTDYLRVVGPGVFVGLGYGDYSGEHSIVSSLIPRPLFFAMIRNNYPKD